MASSFKLKTFQSISFFICICFAAKAFGGISLSTGYSKVGDEIDPKIRREISILNDKLVSGLFRNNAPLVLSLMSPQLIAVMGSGINSFVPQMAGMMPSSNYSVQLEYHSISSKPESPLFLPSDKSVQDKYAISLLSMTKESYESLLSLSESISLLVVYGKHENGWQINIVRAGQMKVGHLSGPDYFRLAKSRLKDGNTIDAVLYSIMSTELLHPLASFFSYDIQDEAEKFSKKVIDEASDRYGIPKTLKAISSNPIIFKLSPHVINDTVHPMISYQTAIAFDDTAALRQEYEMVKIQSNAIFEGISKNRRAVLYRAYAKIPDGPGPVDSYGFSDMIK